jgi:hypothetical protein
VVGWDFSRRGAEEQRRRGVLEFLREQRDSNSLNGGLRFSRRVKEAQRTLN